MDPNILLEELNEDFDLNPILPVLECLVDPVNVVDGERVQPVRNQNYFEIVIPNYNMDDFKAHFRMRRDTFNVS